MPYKLMSHVGVRFPESVLPSLLPLPHLSYPQFSWTCLSLLLCTVGSFSEHLDQINGRSECVDSTDNSSKPSSEPASHMARQRLESTEKKKISGKVTKSLSASALSLMIPGGRETSTRMKLCDLCMWPPPLPRVWNADWDEGYLKQHLHPAQLSGASPRRTSAVQLVGRISSHFPLHQEMKQTSFPPSLIALICSRSFSFPTSQVKGQISLFWIIFLPQTMHHLYSLQSCLQHLGWKAKCSVSHLINEEIDTENVSFCGVFLYFCGCRESQTALKL